jgi:hypothetical protein
MIGFVFACSACADIVRGITMEIHGIRGHSDTPMTEAEWANCSSDMVSAALQMRDIARELERKKDDALVQAGQLMGENAVLGDEVAQLKMRIGCLESQLKGTDHV